MLDGDWQQLFRKLGHMVKRTPPYVGCKALGVTTTFNNDASVEAQHLLARICCDFSTNRAILVCPHIPTKRLRLLQLVILQSLWRVGSLNLTTRQCEVLRGTHQSLLRAVIGMQTQTSGTAMRLL